MKPTTKVLIKMMSRVDSADSIVLEFEKFRKTFEELPGLNYGLTFRHEFPSIYAFLSFILKVKFILPTRILHLSISRIRTTDRKIGYKMFLSVVKTKVTSEINCYE